MADDQQLDLSRKMIDVGSAILAVVVVLVEVFFYFETALGSIGFRVLAEHPEGGIPAHSTQAVLHGDIVWFLMVCLAAGGIIVARQDKPIPRTACYVAASFLLLFLPFLIFLVALFIG